MTPEWFIDEQLRVIRKEFFGGYDEKRFYQERNMLVQAITHPAGYLNERGVRMLPEHYRTILAKVIATIKRHGNRAKIERISAYLLHCVQEHMRHHGEEYYYASKDVRSVVSDVAQRFRRGDAASATFVPALAAAHKALRSRGGRRKKRAPQPGAVLELFQQQQSAETQPSGS